MPTMPGYDQVIGLVPAARRTVPAEFGDVNGHMNVRHYLALYDDAEWEYFERLDLGVAHARAERRGLFALEQHLVYAREVGIGDDVSVHTRLLGRTAKVLHLVSYLVDHTRREVAGSIEVLDAYADLDARRLTPFTDGPALRALDERLAADLALDWAPVGAGCLVLRAPSSPGAVPPATGG